MSFKDLAISRNLNSESDFSEIAQAAIETYYLIPYPNKSDLRPKAVNREKHGGTHVSSTAINVDLLIALYQKYKPEMLRNSKNQPLTPREIKLMKLAALFHDSANISEIVGKEKDHADNFRRDMKELGFSEEEIEPFAMAMQNKHGKHKEENDEKASREAKNIFQKLLDDADRLDVIRVAGDGFDIGQMEIVKDLKSNPDFQKEMEQIVQNHKQTLLNIYGDKDLDVSNALHLQCEFATNCYNAIYIAEMQMLLGHIVFTCLKSGRVITFEEIDTSKLTILDLFNREHSPSVAALIQEILKTPQAKEKKQDKDEVMERYANGGVFVRALKSTEFDTEFKVLNENETALQESKIHDVEGLRAYLAAQKGKEEIWTPPGFKWRPCIFIEAGLPIEMFRGGAGVVIDPNVEKGTFVSYIFKKNALSLKAAFGQFDYFSETGFLKDKKSTSNIRLKFREMTARMTGEEEDRRVCTILERSSWVGMRR